ncbi:MAG: hypothetical protein FWD28_02280 [Treponema sp.]|nr:hypothetical protein [Treponema sp.]
MNGIEAYKIWAPDNALWTEWAKPVLFASNIPEKTYLENIELNIPSSLRWFAGYQQNTAVVIDIPEHTGVEESLTLAYSGYRPVPLYNGVYGDKFMVMAVDVQNLAKALFKGAETLKSVSIRNNAPPVFLLDSRRTSGFRKQPGTFDNRWCVFPQDMPSASFMLRNGINRVILRTEKDSIYNKIKEDLSHILLRYQEAGVSILHTYGDEEPSEIKVSKPSKFKSIFYRFKTLSGLSRNAAGGFGTKIPESTDGHYGYG